MNPRGAFPEAFPVAASRGSLNLFNADVSAKSQRQRSRFGPLRHFVRPRESVCDYVMNAGFGTAVAVSSLLRGSIPVALGSGSVRNRLHRHGERVKL